MLQTHIRGTVPLCHTYKRNGSVVSHKRTTPMCLTAVSTAWRILKDSGSDPAMGMLTAAASAGGIAMPFAVGLLAQRLNIMPRIFTRLPCRRDT